MSSGRAGCSARLLKGGRREVGGCTTGIGVAAAHRRQVGGAGAAGMRHAASATAGGGRETTTAASAAAKSGPTNGGSGVANTAAALNMPTASAPTDASLGESAAQRACQLHRARRAAAPASTARPTPTRSRRTAVRSWQPRDAAAARGMSPAAYAAHASIERRRARSTVVAGRFAQCTAHAAPKSSRPSTAAGRAGIGAKAPHGANCGCSARPRQESGRRRRLAVAVAEYVESVHGARAAARHDDVVEV